MKQNKKEFGWGKWFLIILVGYFIICFYRYFTHLGTNKGLEILIGALLWIFGIGWLVKLISKKIT